MKPEYLPQPSERIAGGVAIIGLFFLIAALIVALSRQPTFRGTMASFAEAGRLSVIGLLLMVGSLVALFVVTKDRRASIKHETEAMRKAAADPPSLSEISTVDSIVVLRWSIDFEAHMRANVSMMRGRFAGPRFAVVLICVIAWISSMYILAIRPLTANLNQVPNMIFLFSSLGIFAVYFVFLAAVLTLSVKKLIRAQYSHTAVQNYALTLDRDGFRLIAGTIDNAVPWKLISNIVEVESVVFIHAIPWQQVIPSYAFHSAGDAKAFVATARALKRNKPVPIHDWSGYTGVTPKNESSWPPPISLSETKL